ncbi:hypothetical protein H0H92_005669 [Tricholoma furcatifolium]|nr:hypothetical protein H0H92_005669 [Tricholoma furcatifolium]
MATTNISSIHPPAVKVAGRRLSITSRPKPAAPAERAPAEPGTPADYPRPVHTETGAGADEHAPPPPHHEDEVPKKEKKHRDMNHEMEKHLRDLAQRKVDATRPSKDMMGAHKGFGAAGRISQPSGKSLGF